MPETQDEYETHDIYLAAYLKIAGCDLVRQRRQGPRMFFIFTNPGGTMKEMRDAYYSGKGQVSAHRFSHEIIGMKQLACG